MSTDPVAQHLSFPFSLKKSRIAAEILLLMLGGLAAAGASAQAVPTPGSVLDTLPPQAPVTPAPGRAASVELPAVRDLQNLDPNGPRMEVSGFRIVGNQSVDTASLQALLAGQAGKPLNLYELNKIARTLTDYYQDRGFPVARALIPAQRIAGGEVTIEVIEGRVDKTVFSGNRSYSAGLLERWGEPLAGHTVRTDTLEERLLKIGDLPGLDVRAVLRPGAEYGTTTVDVAVQEDPVEGQVSLNNYGRREVGETRLDASVNINNPFGIGDQLGFRGSYSAGGLIKMAGLNYSLPLNVEGTRLGLSYTAVDYGIGGALSALDINGKSQLGSVTVIHPFLRSQPENLYGTFSVRAFKGKQSTGSLPLSDNSVVVMEAGTAWNRIDKNSNVAAAGLRVSTNFRDSDDGLKDNAHKFKIDGEASYLYRLAKSWDLRLAGAAQWSPDTLSDAEKFSLGGPNSVRGYPAADVRGDRGAFASLELRYRSVVDGIPGYVSLFTDGGYTARVNPGPGTPHSNTISSAGLGLTFFPGKELSIEVAAAVPTSSLDPSDPRKHGRVWLNLTTYF